ncbi:MAG: hypothetical protein KAI35_09640, partial [Desulfobulbaceae bacterium]|nr:hypothetical protein [Desulfobulbaceae bacterium]
MEKKQAQKQIRDIFQHPFNVDSFKYFIRNLLNDYEVKENKYYKNARLWDKFWPHINSYERIGKYVDPNGDELDILAVEVPRFAKLERARSTLRSLVVKHLTIFGRKDYALAAFYAKEDNGADWRFSFIKIEHTSELVDGKVKIRTDFTPARRYSYLVGEHENSHTAQNQLLDLLAMDYANPAIEQIEAAFSIEKVTNEFFEQYKALFANLSIQLQGQPLFQKESEDESSQVVARFAKKLLGQIVFLYFLQKKGWLGVAQEGNWGTGDKRFLSSLFKKAQGANFYNDFLQYLFYEALAEERKNQPDPAYYKLFECKIPFLNGGLFEADYDWRKQKIDL